MGKLIDYMIPNYALVGASLSEPHTSVTTLLDACVCMYVCLCVAIYQKFQLNKRIHQICTRVGAKSSLMKVRISHYLTPPRWIY